MSGKVNKTFIIQEENEQQCDDCGEIAELRPYGPNGSVICFKCAMKDEEGTAKRFSELLGEFW
jgi:formylmethanofuran dehydrogenase subunit E